MRSFLLLLGAAFALQAAGWRNLFNGNDLDGWEVSGDSTWSVTREGILLGTRPAPAADQPFGRWPVDREAFNRWRNQQSWLYTKEEFEEFDLSLESLLPPGGNSGVSLRDTSRARYSHPPESDHTRTPSHIGYEIQIIDDPNEKYPTGSIYLFAAAKPGMHRRSDWNLIEIESRRGRILVKVNGMAAAESAGDPRRPVKGPIGLQLHDAFSWALFRNVRIRLR